MEIYEKKLFDRNFLWQEFCVARIKNLIRQEFHWSVFFSDHNVPKAKKKSHSRQTHEDCRQAVCILCLKKGDGIGIRESMQNFIVQQGIIQNFLLEKPYLPSGTCSYCRSKVNKFLKTGTPVKS